MNRFILWFVMCAMSLCFCASCGKGGGDDEAGRPYIIKGKVDLDSAWTVNNKIVLFADNHKALRLDTIELSKDGSFFIERHTNGLDELFLCGEQGEICRFYASGDMEVNLAVSLSEEELAVKYQSQHDTINNWLLEHKALFDGKSNSACRQTMDSLIRQNPYDVRVTLLLRDEIGAINDSLFIRQSLGSLKDEAKPDWMKTSIDATLKETGSGKVYNRRLLGATFELKDSIIDFSSSRSDYILISFWADYSRSSIDSLRAFETLVRTQYEDKRVSFMSCCLHAEDSAMWRIRINFLEGNHTWIKGGFSDARMRAWNIKQVPSVILIDMYNNLMQRDVWGGDLRRALDRVPNRIGTKKK